MAAATAKTNYWHAAIEAVLRWSSSTVSAASPFPRSVPARMRSPSKGPRASLSARSAPSSPENRTWRKSSWSASAGKLTIATRLPCRRRMKMRVEGRQVRRQLGSPLAALVIACVLLAGNRVFAAEAGFKAGVATRLITPSEPMWLAGYGSRNHPAEGKEQDLYVKAVALEDRAGHKLVLMTSDLVGIPRPLAEAVTAAVQRQTGLPRASLMLSVSHTHCGPVVRGSLNDMYNMPPEEWRKVEAYTEQLRGWMIETIVNAVHDLKPAHLAAGKGTARFAVNRRKPTPSGFVNDANPGGPVDHDVPVLKVESPDGKLRAVVFGYACHNTTLQFYRWCGDYAGFAMADLEAKHPGVTALFWI